jgi:hypothetical protein
MIAKRMDKHFFDYTQLAKDAWVDLLKKAHDRYDIYFNNENDDASDQKKLKIENKIVPDSPYDFRCELRYAGGDWEYPVIYFRVQSENILLGTDLGRLFCVIPGKEEGNPSLKKGSKRGWVTPSNSDTKKEDVEDPDEKKAWEFLEKYLTEIVNKKTKEGSVNLKRIAENLVAYRMINQYRIPSSPVDWTLNDELEDSHVAAGRLTKALIKAIGYVEDQAIGKLKKLNGDSKKTVYALLEDAKGFFPELHQMDQSRTYKVFFHTLKMYMINKIGDWRQQYKDIFGKNEEGPSFDELQGRGW